MIFVDTWAWVALAIKRDQYHSIAMAQHQRFRNPKRKYVTTDYIISELISSLYRAGPVTLAQGYVQALLSKVDTGDYLLVHVTSDQFRRAWAMRQKYYDKPDISFVDFTSMVVMQDLGIQDVFTGDAHFQQVNLGFRLHP